MFGCLAWSVVPSAGQRDATPPPDAATALSCTGGIEDVAPCRGGHADPWPDRHLFDNLRPVRVIVAIVDQLPEGMSWHDEN